MKLSSIARTTLSFVLAFSLTLGAQGAFAADASTGGTGSGGSGTSTDTGGTGSETGGGGSTDKPSDDNPPTKSHYVEDIGIYDHDSPRVVYAYASGKTGSAEVSSRGGQIDFDALSIWDDGTTEGGYANVTWKADDTSVGTIDAKTGEFTAKDNGTVVVTCTTTKPGETDGATLEASVRITVTGQDTTPFVTRIVICDDTGAAIYPSYTFPEGTKLATAELDLQATVTVFDPISETSKEYQVTPTSGLSAQTGGALPDLTWESGVVSFGTVSAEGIYRPSVAATNEVIASSSAGESGVMVSGVATIIMLDENGNGQKDGAHPQDSLTIEAEWETQPGVTAISKTFSVGDLEALGTSVKAYTAMGAGQYITITGRGPSLYKVLEAAGIDTSGGVKSLQAKAYDNDFEVSWSLLGETGRYYFPNIDIDSYAEAVPVWPMIAIDSKEIKNSCTVYSASELSSNARFRLLFGASMEGGVTTDKQIKWIHTLHIVLAGSPPASDGPTDDNGNGNGGGSNTDPGTSDNGENASGDGGSGSDSIDATVRGDSSGEMQQSANSEQQADSGTNDANAQTASPTDTDDANESVSSGQEGRVNEHAWTILQAVNNNESVADQLDFENPFEPFALPAAAGLVAAGGVESFARFRLQLRGSKVKPEK